MRFKTLLLGSAAAFAFAGGAAQAADLSVAEPVDYVRVCDAFGAGFWYIPGTDTCIKIGGEVEFRTYFYDDGDEYINSYGDTDHTSSWQFRTQFDLNVTTKSMTDWGPLTTFVNLTSTSNDGVVSADEYYLSLGPVLLGLTQSAFDIVGDGYTKTYGSIATDPSDHKVDQVQLSWAINGFGLVLALEDSKDRWGSSTTSDLPDLVAALSASGTGWSAAVSFLYADLVADTQWAVQGNVEFDVWGDSLQIGALFADDGTGGDGGALKVEDGWLVLLSYKHNWSSNLYSAVTFEYYDSDDVAGDGYDVAFTTAFSPASGLWVGADLTYSEIPTGSGGGDVWRVVLFAERAYGD